MRGRQTRTPFKSGPLTVDLASRSVIVNRKLVKLTGTEYALLRLFVRNAGKVLTHPQIMEAVPGKPALLLTEARRGGTG